MDADAPATGREASTEAGLRALLIPVGRDVHALPMTSVREVVAAPLVTPLPTAPPTVLGVFNLRGEIVPMFDLATLLGFGTAGTCEFAVVVETASGPAGLAATAVPESVALGEPTGATESDGMIAAYAIGSRLATLLDLDVLLAPGRIGGWAS